MAVGEAKTLPTPKPIMYNPVVSATCETETSKSLATFVKPAARTGVIPPPTMQYSPRDNSAQSLCHAGQLSGSLWESSGCGSRMIAPSGVFFLFACEDDVRAIGVAGNEGTEEVEVRAGAFLMPRGSLRLPVSNRTDPVSDLSMPCLSQRDNMCYQVLHE